MKYEKEKEIILPNKKVKTTCSKCGVNLSFSSNDIINNSTLICPNCENAFEAGSFKNKLISKVYVKRDCSFMIKCTKCNCEFKVNTNDFYFSGNEIHCPKCKVLLTQDSIINVYLKLFGEDNLLETLAKEKKSFGWLIFLIVLFAVVYICVVCFS